MRVATYAKPRSAAPSPFAQAAFRQAFAGGHSLAEQDFVLIAAAACEMHPAAVLRGAALRSVAAQLARGDRAARNAGVRDVPAVRRRRARASAASARSHERSARAGGRRVRAKRRLPADRHARRARAGAARRPGALDHVEVVEIASGEVAMLWDLAPHAGARNSRGRSAAT